jgi:hypothetical protein
MRFDGVGGPRDIDGVRSFIGCASHSDWSWCDYLDAKEHDPRIGPYNYCDGATVTVAECSSRDLANVTTKVQLHVKSIAQRLDGKGRGFLRTAGHTYDAYVDAMGAYVAATCGVGTGAGARAAAQEIEMQSKRAEQLAKTWGFVAKQTSSAQVRRAEQARVAACSQEIMYWRRFYEDDNAECRLQTGEDCNSYWRNTLAELSRRMQETETTWNAYRDAEIAFHVHLFGASQGVDRVRMTLLVRLETSRAKECATRE